MIALGPHSAMELKSLRSQRRALAANVVEVINTFGPEIYPSFEDEKLVHSQQDLLECSGNEDHELHGDYATYTSELKSTPAHDWAETNETGESTVDTMTGANSVKTSSVRNYPSIQTLRMRSN
ncbi:hypothetical protein KCU77_g783, partial [Aureobasidium melanogenum]